MVLIRNDDVQKASEFKDIDAPLNIKYATSPTLIAFHNSDVEVRGLMGPFGSGKSVGCVMELFIRAMQQMPDKKGVRRTRWLVVRNTFGDLIDTTIKTLHEWFPPDVCKLVLSPRPRANMFIPHPADDGTWIDMELCFLALDGTMDSGKVLSREITGAWINEAREIHFTNIKDVIGRYGRFPKVDKSYNYGPTWCGVIMDTNAPSDQHWWYRMFEVEKPPKWQLFKQPGALMENPDGDGYVPNPDAENIDNIHQGYGYYFRMLAGADQQEIRWKILGRYATSYEGKPVYDLYDDDRHCSKESLAIFGGLPLYLGWDFGVDAACVAAQLSPEGQLRVLREWILKRGYLQEFVEEVVRPALKNDFHDMRIISTGDPSGRLNDLTGTTPFDELRRMGIPTMKAVTNEFAARRASIMSFMSRSVAGGEPAYLLDPSCKVLREGKRGAYQFALMKTTIDEAHRPLPDKNFYSHPADAEQCIGLTVTHSRPPTNRVGRRSLVSAAEAWGAMG